MESTSQLATKALHSDVDLTDHFKVVDWCLRNIDRCHLLDTHERHNKAAQIQIEAAVLTRSLSQDGSQLKETPPISVETAVSVAFSAMSNEIERRFPLNEFDIPETSALSSWAQRNVPGVMDLHKRARQRLIATALTALIRRNDAKFDTQTCKKDEKGTLAKEADDRESPRPPVAESESHQQKIAKKRNKNAPKENKMLETVEDIASRFPQQEFAFDRPHIVYSWCVLNVVGFVASHINFRKEISEAVIEYLADKGSGKDMDEPNAQQSGGCNTIQVEEDVTEETIESATARKQRKKREKWYKQVYEPTESIARRFPRHNLNYSDGPYIIAWCDLNVDGFAESGVIWRHRIPDEVRRILLAKYGPYVEEANEENSPASLGVFDSDMSDEQRF